MTAEEREILLSKLETLERMLESVSAEVQEIKEALKNEGVQQ